jgi:hypothetical protein
MEDIIIEENQIDENEQQVYDVLNKLNIPYARDTHEACFTVEQAKEHGLNRPGINVKNLVILDKKTGEHFMVILMKDGLTSSTSQTFPAGAIRPPLRPMRISLPI